MTDPTNPASADYDPTIQDWGYQYDVAEGPNHGIDETVTGGAFASVRHGAWHKLGVVSDRQVDTLTLLQMAHGDYPIYSAPIVAQVERRDALGHLVNVEFAEDTRRVNVMRDHPETGAAQILGQASAGYPLWTPREVFVGFGDAILGQGEPTVSTAGVLHEGRQAFMSWQLPHEVIVGGLTDEAIRLWLVVHTSFDQSSATTAMVTPIRAVCANTVRVGKRKAVTKLSVRKTRNAKLDAMQARTALELIVPVRKELITKGEAMLSTKVGNQQFLDIIAANWGPGDEASKKALDAWEPKKNALMHLFTTADTQANVRNTAWGALQAVTEYADWFVGVRGMGADTSVEDLAAAQFRRSLFGPPKGAIENTKATAEAIFGELAGV